MMFYAEILQELMKDKKNPVNSMYLHEINIKWGNFEKFIKEDKEEDNAAMLEALDNFISAISNPKYIYNHSTKNGFKPDSLIFSSRYLDDMISIFMKRNPILINKGISWGFQRFSTHLKFNPRNLSMMGKNPMFQQDYSERILCLVQKMDFQFRVSGKRNFHRYEINFPLLLFKSFKNLTEEDFIRTEHAAELARESFERSKTIIVCETLSDNYIPTLKSSPVDDIYILRKQFRSRNKAGIDIKVVDSLEKRIRDYLSQSEERDRSFLKTGIIH